jgi:hypothetical protein
MPRRLAYFYAVISALLIAQVLCARVWTDKDGRGFEAEFVSQDADKVSILRLSDRREFTIEKSQLSSADLELLNKLQGSVTAVEDKVTPSRAFPEDGLEWENRITAPNDFSLEIVLEDNSTNTYHYRSNHFDFHSNVKLARKVVTEFAEIFEATLVLIQQSPLSWQLKIPDTRFQAKLYETESQYLADGGMPGSSGVYKGQTQTIYIPLSSLGTKKTSSSITFDGGDRGTLIHEITHQVQDACMWRMPTWLREGYADYIEAMTYERGTFRPAQTELDRGWSKTTQIDPPLELLRISNIEWNAKFQTDPFAVTRQYRSAYILVYYFIHLDGEGGGRRFWAYLRALESAKSQEAVNAAIEILIAGRSEKKLLEEMVRAFSRENLDLEIF